MDIPVDSMDRPAIHQFFDILHQTEHPPLALNLVAPTQREAIQALVGTDIAENRIHYGHAVPVNHLVLATAHTSLHPVGTGATIRYLPPVPIARIGRLGLRASNWNSLEGISLN